MISYANEDFSQPQVKRVILERVSSGHYRSANEVVRRGFTLLQKDEERAVSNRFSGLGDLATIFGSIPSDVPDAGWQRVPADLSKNLDHFPVRYAEDLLMERVFTHTGY